MSMEKDMDWGSAIVVDPRRLHALATHVETLRRTRLLLKVTAGALAVIAGAVSVTAYHQSGRLTTLAREVRDQRKSAERAGVALAALARTHDNILNATEQAPSVGTRSWGRRFTVTKYIPRSPAYGKDNDGLTSTMKKADPKARIVAVDPKLIPYGSWIWVEELGWYQAQDCGSAIKGFRLDILTGTEKDAFDYGRKDRFAIVVPPDHA